MPPVLFCTLYLDAFRDRLRLSLPVFLGGSGGPAAGAGGGDRACGGLMAYDRLEGEFCPLHVFEELLRQDCFLKVNRSTIINMNYVEKVEDNAFVMKGGMWVAMKSRDSRAIRDTYFEWMFSNI